MSRVNMMSIPAIAASTGKQWSRSLARPLVGGVSASVVSRRQLTDEMTREHGEAAPGHAAVIFASNGATISQAARDDAFRALMETADVVTADGQSIVNGARFAGVQLPERVATTDLFVDVATASPARDISHYLLGGEAGLAEKCAERLRAQCPGISIVGTHHGYLNEVDEDELVAAINAVAPDVLWVGMGVPHEHRFVHRNRDQLAVRWIVTCGGCFNYVTGGYPRAPLILQKFGLEWLFRLLHDPRRLFWRYAITNPHALWLMMTRSRAERAR